MDPFQIIIIALVVVLLALVVVVLLRPRHSDQTDWMRELLQSMQQQLATTTTQNDQRLAQVSEQLSKSINELNKQLGDRLHQSQTLNQQAQQSIQQRLQTADKTLGDLKGQLGQLHQATLHIAQVGQDVRKLQDILQTPKLRGGLGEWTLDNLLAQVLPQQHYELQHRFQSGVIVDALVKLAQGNVCIDAKFPLPNFQAMLEAPDEAARQKTRRQFRRDVAKRIEEVAEKYILPEQGTLDFALMFVPAENVYYEAMITQPDDLDIAQLGRERHVICVSPNTLYAYLMVIASGLRGLQIEKHAQRLRQQLSQLASDIELFQNDFNTVSKHLNNAHARQDDAHRRLDQFILRLQQITHAAEPDTEET